MASITSSMTDAEVLAELGRRLRRYRLDRQGESSVSVAEAAGLSRVTVEKAERGGNPTLETLVRLLRAYGRLDALEAFLPEPTVSPMEVLRRGTGRRRQRAPRRTEED
ncbi:MAG TPA: helix-turn-helix transcriptional regulator [Longimicrobiales bacterium]|nr:helix-turn-helix transcriptional regulator [Longimicrobiales bacterium]